MAMPWSRAKQIAAALRGKGEFPEGYTGSRTVKELTALFDACFRIQREAIEAAGHFIPLVVENVRGAQEWVGRSRWNYGSYHLWGDVPALMPLAVSGIKRPGMDWKPPGHPKHQTGAAFNSPPAAGRKGVGSGAEWWQNNSKQSSKSTQRREWSARIAMIPEPLARWIGRVYLPQ